MVKYEFFLASALEKVFPDHRPTALAPGSSLSVWRGQKAAVQLVYTARNGAPNMPVQQYRLEVSGGPCNPRVRRVELIPCQLPCYEASDEHYISKVPGLFPDLLSEPESCTFMPLPRQYRSLWLTFDIPEDALPGAYPVTIRVLPCCHTPQPNGEIFHDPDAENQIFDLQFILKVGRTDLPRQNLLHTEWFHCDCLAEYYGVETFSEPHWQIIENYVAAAAEHGINMLLTPVFTPPLDTPVGRERMTIQLVDIYKNGDHYTFGFEKLARWAAMCRRHGITHLEIPHLFTQWGAAATPKIVACVDGIEKRIFGWDVPAGSAEYRRFLEAFLPAVRKELDAQGFDIAHVYYHISDEPSPEHLDAYHTALRQTAGLLDGCNVMDALCNYAFFQQGLVQIPVVANDYIQPFFDNNASPLWVYYCCVQGNFVPNRFIAMPSARNRIMGVLMYLYRTEGFLHWGFNFYNARFSVHRIDPFRTADGDLSYPAGDPFLVYPGPQGQPQSSIRAEVQDDALLDLRALQLLERLTEQKFVEDLILQEAGMEVITFKDYPRDPEFLLRLRERVACEIEKRV